MIIHEHAQAYAQTPLHRFVAQLVGLCSLCHAFNTVRVRYS